MDASVIKTFLYKMSHFIYHTDITQESCPCEMYIRIAQIMKRFSCQSICT